MAPPPRRGTDWPGYTATIDSDFRPPVPRVVIDNCASGTTLQKQAKTLLDGIIGAMTPAHQHGIILYEPPAAGNDTVIEALSRLNSRCVQYPLLKVGPGRTTGYRAATPDAIDAIDAIRALPATSSGSTDATGALYVIDRPTLGVNDQHRRDRPRLGCPPHQLLAQSVCTAALTALDGIRHLNRHLAAFQS